MTQETFKNTVFVLRDEMYRFAKRFVVSVDEAEDVVQDTFVELWKRKDELSDENHIRAFLFRTVYTRSLNVLKHRGITQNYAESMQQLELQRAQFYQPNNNETLQHIEDEELRGQIQAAINELPDKCREVFIMSYIHEMKNKEIADLMSLSVKTVEVHIYKALKFLRKRLDYLTFLSLIFLLGK